MEDDGVAAMPANAMAIAVFLKKSQPHDIDVIDLVDGGLEHQVHGFRLQDAIFLITACLQVGDHELRHVIGSGAHGACGRGNDELERSGRLGSGHVAFGQVCLELLWHRLLEGRAGHAQGRVDMAFDVTFKGLTGHALDNVAGESSAVVGVGGNFSRWKQRRPLMMLEIGFRRHRLLRVVR